MSDDRQDSGIAHGSFDASSGSAAAVAVAELLDGASVGSFEHQLRSEAQWAKTPKKVQLGKPTLLASIKG